MYLSNCDVTILLVPRNIWVIIVLDFINLFHSLSVHSARALYAFFQESLDYGYYESEKQISDQYYLFFGYNTKTPSSQANQQEEKSKWPTLC